MNLLLLFAVPIIFFLIVVSSVILCIYLYAKSHGDIKQMSAGQKKLYVASILLPVVLLVGGIGYFGLTSSNARKQLAKDIESGALTVYHIDDTATESTQRISISDDNSKTLYLSFDIFAENLYVNKENGDIRIRTNEFDSIEQIRRNSFGFIRFFQEDETLDSVERYENFIKEERRYSYTKSETALGTVFEVVEKDSYRNSGRFMYKVFFKSVEYSMLISVSYNSEEDLRVRYAPIVSQKYAKALYDLIIQTIKINPLQLPEVYDS